MMRLLKGFLKISWKINQTDKSVTQLLIKVYRQAYDEIL